MGDFRYIVGECPSALFGIQDKSVKLCVTSPPYWGLRCYGNTSQIGHEKLIDDYIDRLISVFAEVHRILKDDGTLWVVMGDSYAGSWGNYGARKHTQREVTTSHRVRQAYEGENGWDGRPPTTYFKENGLKEKDLCGVPWRLATALRTWGWYLRRDIIWDKEFYSIDSVSDRPSQTHEYIFMLSKNATYSYDRNAANGMMLNFDPRRSVWSTCLRPKGLGHPASFPIDIIVPIVLMATDAGDIVLDPFCGVGTSIRVAVSHGRMGIGVDLNFKYIQAAKGVSDDSRIGSNFIEMKNGTD